MSGVLMAAGAFSGAGGITNPLGSGFGFGNSAPGSPASANITFGSTGNINYGGGGDFDSSGPVRWHQVDDASSGASSWIRATVTSGTLTSGTTGVWLALSTSRTFTKGPASSGGATAVVTFEFATDAAGTNIVTTSPGWQIGYGHSL